MNSGRPYVTFFLGVVLCTAQWQITACADEALVWRCEPWPECEEFRSELRELGGDTILLHDSDSSTSLERAEEETARYSTLILGDTESGIVVPAREVEYMEPGEEYYDPDWIAANCLGPNPYDIHTAMDVAIRASEGRVVQTAIGDAAGAKLALLGGVEEQLNVRLPDGTLVLWDDQKDRVEADRSDWPSDSLAVVLIDPSFSYTELSMSRDLELPSDSVLDALVPQDIGDVAAYVIETVVPGEILSSILGEIVNVVVDYFTPTSTATGIDRGDVSEIREIIGTALTDQVSEASGYLASLEVISVPQACSPIEDFDGVAAGTQALSYLLAARGGWDDIPACVDWTIVSEHEFFLYVDAEHPNPVDYLLYEFGNTYFAHAPVFSEVEDLSVNRGDWAEVKLSATDRDGDCMEMRLISPTEGALLTTYHEPGLEEALMRWSSALLPATSMAMEVAVEAVDETGQATQLTFQISVSNTNHAPEATTSFMSTFFSFVPSGPKVFIMDPAWYEAGCLGFMDRDGDSLTFALGTHPQKGTASLLQSGSGGSYSVTVMYEIDRDAALASHTSGDPFIDYLSVVATDPFGATAETDVEITVDVLNTAPNSMADEVETPMNTAVDIDVLANDTDIEGDELTIVFVSTPGVGASSASHNIIHYEPLAGFYGDTAFTYTVSDGYGGEATESVLVHVVDEEPPVFVNAPSDIGPLSNDEGVCGAAVTWSEPTVGVDVTDNIGIANLACTHAAGSVFDIGSTVVTYTATDLSGNRTDRTFTVTVDDRELPEIADGPDDVCVEAADGTEVAIVAWAEPTATDNCGVVSVAPSHTSGSAFPVGDTDVTYTATDIHANVVTHSFAVSVCRPWSLDCRDVHVTTGDPDGTDVSFDSPVVDGCPGTVEVTFNSASGSQFPIGTTSVSCTATDGSRTETGTFEVTVEEANDDPVANDDAVFMADGDLQIQVFVLGNDEDDHPGTLTVSRVFGPTMCGDAWVDAGGTSVWFMPTGCPNDVWVEFSYEMEDRWGATDTATVMVKTPPTGPIPRSAPAGDDER